MTAYRNMIKALSPVKAYDLSRSGLLNIELTIFSEILDEVSAEIDNIIKESIIASAENKGLRFYESLLRTSGASDNPSLAERRENVFAAISLNDNSNTLSAVQSFFGSIGFECSIIETANIFDVYISPHGSGFTAEDKAYIREKAAEFLPCHLTFLIDFRTVTWADYDNRQLTFRDLDFMQLSWEEIENTDF